MFKFALDSAETFLILTPRWPELGTYGQIGVLAFLLLAPLGLILWLYRYELHLISRWSACGLLGLRTLMLLVLWLVIGLQPHLADVHVKEIPSRVRVAIDLSSSMDIVDTQSLPAEKLELARVLKLNTDHDQALAAVAKLSRKAISARILSAEGLNLLQRLQQRHEVEIVGFARQPVSLQPEQVQEKLAAQPSQDVQATDLRLALANPSSRYEQPLLGIVLLSDGQHNVDTAPYERAAELGKQRIPIFPVVIGSREPPHDLAIFDVQARAKAFKDETVKLEIRCKATSLPAQKLMVEMRIDGKPVRPEHRKVIEHTGKDAMHTVRFQARMDEVGSHLFSIKATSKTGKEITLANNQAERIIRVIDDKTRVLLVDGEARWEYQYLANALLRDPRIQLDRVVFSQPRIGIIKEPELEKLGFARTKLPEPQPEAKGVDPLMNYDCILLGDVAPEQLPIAERRRLEKYVAERGGTLILMAGKRYLPLAYLDANDPLAKMFPITDAQVLQSEEGFTLRLTTEGKRLSFMQLIPRLKETGEPDEEEERRHPFAAIEPQRHGVVKLDPPKHYWGIVGKRKPAASVLLTPQRGALEPAAKGESDSGILLQQNYGRGRVLFVGLDSTWRWRYRISDTYHHGFWGQMVRSAADKLLPAGNHLVRYGPREPVYADGDEVELAVRLHESLPPLKDLAQARAKLYRQNADGSEVLAAVVPLSLNSRQKQYLEATLPTGHPERSDLPVGTYRMELDIPPYRAQIAMPSEEKDRPVKGRDLFRLLPRENKELLDLATNVPLLQTLANNSNGKLYTPMDVEQLLDRLARRIERQVSREESKPWQDAPLVWWLLGLLLGLLTLEWGWRKWLDLP